MFEFHLISVIPESIHCVSLEPLEFVNTDLEYTSDYSDSDEICDKKVNDVSSAMTVCSVGTGFYNSIKVLIMTRLVNIFDKSLWFVIEVAVEISPRIKS